MKTLYAFLFAILAAPATAATYQYTSGPLANVAYISGGPGPTYTPMPPDLTSELTITLDAMLAPSTTYFDFVDEVTATFQGDDFDIGFLDVTTDATGAIVDWNLFASQFDGSDFYVVTSQPTTGDIVDYNFEYDGFFNPATGVSPVLGETWEVRFFAGEWTQVTAVPLPASSLMLLAGLGLIGGFRLRKRA